jgi:hypothetical protein
MKERYPQDSSIVTAHHEAGHGVLARCFGWGVERLTIIPGDGQYGGCHLVGGDAPSASDPPGTIAFLSAGYCAEVVLQGWRNESIGGDFWGGGGSTDIGEARQIARQYLGYDDQHASAPLKAIASCVLEFIRSATVGQRVDAMASPLLAKQTLYRNEIEAIWQASPVPTVGVQQLRERMQQAVQKAVQKTKPKF